MIRHRWQVYGVVAAALALNVACWVWTYHRRGAGPMQTVRVMSVLPGDEADNADRFTLVFDREVVPRSRVGEVESAALFEVSPAWPGQWRWAGPETLQFLLEKPLPPGRVFTLTAADELPHRLGMTLEGEKTFRFRTRALELSSCQIKTSSPQEATFELVFNQPVDPDELLRRLRVYDRREAAAPAPRTADAPDAAVPANLAESMQLTNLIGLTKTPSERLVIRSPRPQSHGLAIVLDAGLAGHEGELPLGRDVFRTLVISPRLSVVQAWAAEPGLEETLWVRVRFTHALKTGQQLPELAVEPPVEGLRHHVSDHELVISGKFTPGRRYVVKVPGTLLDRDGGTLGEDQQVGVSISSRRPGLVIPYWSGVLSPHGSLLLEMKVVNVPSVDLSAWRVHPNNLVHYLAEGNKRTTSRALFERTFRLDVPPETPETVALDLRKLLGEPRGLYYIDARSSERWWTRDGSVVCITDLAITAKRERSGAVVWVTSLRSGRPVEGATVRAFTVNNQVLSTSRTDDSGLARLRFPAGHPDGTAWIITAERDDDLSYLRTDENQWVIDDVDQSGRARPEAYEVMLYTERGVYRPGDVVHLTGIARDRDGDVPPAFPLSVQVMRPDGRLVADEVVTPEAGRQGMFHFDFTTREDGQTGPYRFRVMLPGSKEVLGSGETLVEAFIPVRMEVKAAPTSERFGPGDEPKVTVDARYLWDQPASGLAVALDGTLRAVPFRSKRHPGFRFHVPAARASDTLASVAGQLDDAGRAELALKLPALDDDVSMCVMQVAATVTEPGGRSVSANTSAQVDRWDRHIGLRLADGQLIEVGKPLTVDWVALTAADGPAEPAAMRMTLQRVDYDSVLKEVNRRWVWQSCERTEDVRTEEIAPTPGSGGSLTVRPEEAGRYRVSLVDAETKRGAQLDFWVSDSGAAKQSVAMDRPERLEIVLDRGKYVPGDAAKVLVRSPIPGVLFLTLETDEVLWTHVAEVTQNTAEIELTLPERLRGSAFVAGTVVRAVDPTRKSWLPHRAMGLARVDVDHASREVPVVIRAPKNARPGETITVTVDASSGADPDRPAVVHLWAVDEGILLTTAYRTPEPMKFFLGDRALGVDSSDLFYRLLPDFERPAGMTRIGAGGGPLEDWELDYLRTSPVPSTRREPAVIWRTNSSVDADGRLTATLALPDLTGQLRLMAVVADGDRYGHARHDVTLSSPLMVESTWPRFAAPGDVFEVPVKLFNATDAALTVNVKPTLAGPVELAGGDALDAIDVAPGKPVTRFLRVKATGMGPVAVRLDASADAGGKPLAAHSTADFPVRPASALHGEVKLVMVEAGDEITIAPPDTLVPGTVRMKLDVSARPAVQLAPALEQLIGYPYGCVEQTTSRLYALLWAADILGSERIDAISGMIQAGIARLWSMQTRSGGLSYWPGNTYPCLWGTAYASGCLLEAAAAGHKIDERFLKELAKFCDEVLRETGRYDVDVNTKALFCRVLAVFGEAPTGWMSKLAERKDELDLEGRCHLAAAYHAAGRRDRALELLPAESPAVIPTTTSEMRLTSRVRQEAVWLSVLLEVDPGSPAVVPLAAKLERARVNGDWGSTLNNAAAIAALSRYQATRTQNPPRFTGEVRAPGKPPVKFDHARPLAHTLERLDGPVTVGAEGAGTVYVSTSVEGLAKPGVVKPYNRDLTVTRTWLDRNRKPVEPRELAVGDLVQVEITLVSTRDDVSNVVIVDALPAAMEPENPRLVTSARMDEVTGDTPDRVEFLDDRVVLFSSASRTVRRYRYALRVTTAGDFDVPPIQASCMYDASVASLGAPSRVSVRK